MKYTTNIKGLSAVILQSAPIKGGILRLDETNWSGPFTHYRIQSVDIKKRHLKLKYESVVNAHPSVG